MKVRPSTNQPTLFDLGDGISSSTTRNGQIKPIYKSAISKEYDRLYPNFRKILFWLTPLAEENIILDSLLKSPYKDQFEALKYAYEKLASAHLRLSLRAEMDSQEGTYHSYKGRYYNSIFGTLITISKPPFQGNEFTSLEDLIKPRLRELARGANLEVEMHEALGKNGHTVALTLWIARKIADRDNPKSDPQRTLF